MLTVFSANSCAPALTRRQGKNRVRRAEHIKHYSGKARDVSIGEVACELRPSIFTGNEDPNVANFAYERIRLIRPAGQECAEVVVRLVGPTEEQEAMQELRTDLAIWATSWHEKLNLFTDLRSKEALLSELRQESEAHANPQTADIVEALQKVLIPVLGEAKKAPAHEQLTKLVKTHLPVFIYFENYGILDSAIYLPRFLEDLKNTPNDPRVRTINAMFKHVGLTAQEIRDLGIEQAQQARAQKQEVTAEMIAQDQQQKEARAIKLNSASLDITARFNDWYPSRRHTIDYQADGDYFRIWVADDRRPGVKIELEAQ
jgi:hypothetical protein